MPARSTASVPRRVRNLANLVNLSTPLGLIAAAVGRGHIEVDRQRGLVIAEQVRLPFVTAGAMTIGDVVLVLKRTREDLVARHPDVLHHEEQHSWQWSYCLGLPFLPLYFAMMAWSTWRTGNRAWFNFFEQQAGLVTGGYLKAGQKATKKSDRGRPRPAA